MPVASLHQLARTACIKNIQSITDVGDIPYELIRPVLVKLKNPEQLRDLEQASPQLIGHDAEIWREFIKRDIENWQEKLREPKNPAGWYKLYRRLRREEQEDIVRQEEILRTSMQSIKEQQATRTSKVVDPRTVPKLPRANGMRIEKGRGLHLTASRPDQSSLQFGAGSKTKTLTGQGVISKARREAKEMSLFSSRNSMLARPTHQLNAKATQLRVAPPGLIAQHKRPAGYGNDVEVKKTSIMVPRRTTTTDAHEKRKRERDLDALASPEGKRPMPRSPVAQDRSQLSPVEPSSPTPLLKEAYKVPVRKPSPDSRGFKPAMKPRAPVDIFMPAKRKRVR